LKRYNNAFAAVQHEHGVFRQRRRTHSEGFFEMAEGTIKRLTDKGFGFIDTGTDKDLFFHHSSLEGVSYEELKEGQRVTFTEGSGPKGPRAENVKLA
jgi:CspA family cold shock protein